jgi:hypothetical protein
MSTLTTINGSDLPSNSRVDINNNFDALNTDKLETSYLDTDNTLAANSDTKIPSQKAVKTYVDAGGNVNASETNKGIVEEATDAEVTAGTATGATGAKLFVTPAKLATRLTSTGTSPVVRVYTDNSVAYGSATTRFDITNPSGTTFRYTFDGTGTNPTINTTTFPTGAYVRITNRIMSDENCGYFAITGSDDNYFEVTNASGVAEDDKAMTSGSLRVTTLQTWTKPTGLKYVTAEALGAGGGGGGVRAGGTAGGGGGGGYAKKLISVASLGATESVLVGYAGTGEYYDSALVTEVNGEPSKFGSHILAGGGSSATEEGGGAGGGAGSSGDINITGGSGFSGDGNDYRGGKGGDSIFGFGGSGGLNGGGSGGVAYGSGGGGASHASNVHVGGAGTNGIVIVTEYYI